MAGTLRATAAATVLTVASLVVAGVSRVGGGTAGAGDERGPTSGVVYDSEDDNVIQDLFLAAPATGRKPGVVRLFFATDCGAGYMDATVRADGRVKGHASAFDLSEDEQEILLDARVSGGLAADGGSGTLQVTVDEGPACEADLEWRVTRERTEPDLRRLEAVVASPNPDYNPALAVNGDGVYTNVPSRRDPERSTTIARIDPATNEIDWKTDVAVVVDDFVATADALWLVDAGDGAVHRFDLEQRELTAQIPLGDPAEPSPDVPAASVAATADAVWAKIGTSGVVHRIDPATNDVGATFEAGAPVAELALGPEGLYVEIVLPPAGEPNATTAESERPLRTDGAGNTERSRLVRLDPGTTDVAAETVTTALWDLEVGPDGLYTSEGIRAIVRRDPRSLVEQVRGDYITKAIGIAPPGVWLSGFDTAAVASDTLEQRADLPDIGTNFARGLVTGFDSVWYADAGAVNRFRAGETPAT